MTERTRPWVLAPLLVGLAALSAHAGQFAQAAACLGAAEAQGPLSTHAQADYDQAAAKVRTGLDAATCAAGWARGGA